LARRAAGLEGVIPDDLEGEPSEEIVWSGECVFSPHFP
jgi:hypothetical protein